MIIEENCPLEGTSSLFKIAMDFSVQEQHCQLHNNEQHQSSSAVEAYDPSQAHHHQQQQPDNSSTLTYPHPDPGAGPAVTALSQLSEFTGTMDAAAGAAGVPPPLAPYPQHYSMEHGLVAGRPPVRIA